MCKMWIDKIIIFHVRATHIFHNLDYELIAICEIDPGAMRSHKVWSSGTSEVVGIWDIEMAIIMESYIYGHVKIKTVKDEWIQNT